MRAHKNNNNGREKGFVFLVSRSIDSISFLFCFFPPPPPISTSFVRNNNTAATYAMAPMNVG